MEQIIVELKNDLCVTGIRTDTFWANDALFLTGLIAYNLLSCIRRLGLQASLRTVRVKRLRLLFFHLGASAVWHSKMLWGKISHDYPFRLIFYRTMAGFSAA